ncbi:hypothetical protein BD410DRAFT_755325 [Rickenella mellea]|uniref:Protein kinase domain-containing protein n=1 Tax=Rickenella mellea TaxID=50990 RepID=A0A4Y7PNX9_9AGAM|nr:hypothetical protein BD410DRAFT_755325 [Rickenella mellea]
MSSLVVNCAVNVLQDFFPFILTRLPIDGTSIMSNEPPVYFMDGEEIHRGNGIRVSRGKLHREGDTLDVAVKFDFYKTRHADLVEEASLYEKQAKAAQGTALPVFYGIYHGTVDSRSITCLILEYCGSPMENSLDEASEEFSFKVAKRLMTLHSAGLQHNDISESNIVVNNDEPRLIDLGHATLHTCKRTLDIEPNELRPTMLKFGCRELHNFASQQGIWEPTDIFYHGSVIPKKLLKSMEDLIAMTPSDLLETAKDRERIYSEAREILRSLGVQVTEEEVIPRDVVKRGSRKSKVKGKGK